MISAVEADERRAAWALRSERPQFKTIRQFVIFLRAIEASYVDGVGLQSVTQGCLERSAEAALYGCVVEDLGRYKTPEAKTPVWVQHGDFVRDITRGIEGLGTWYEVAVKGRTLVEVAKETGIRHQRLSETVGDVNRIIMMRLGNV